MSSKYIPVSQPHKVSLTCRMMPPPRHSTSPPTQHTAAALQGMNHINTLAYGKFYFMYMHSYLCIFFHLSLWGISIHKYTVKEMWNIYIFYTTAEYERIIGYRKILRQYWGFFDWIHIICNYNTKHLCLSLSYLFRVHVRVYNVIIITVTVFCVSIHLHLRWSDNGRKELSEIKKTPARRWSRAPSTRRSEVTDSTQRMLIWGRPKKADRANNMATSGGHH